MRSRSSSPCPRARRKLVGKKAIITGADSWIGRAVALAFAREGADVPVAYLNEHDDAKETQRLIEEAGRKALKGRHRGTGSEAPTEHRLAVRSYAVPSGSRHHSRRRAPADV
jgi:NAD(P)-dependent dehydrogenase (short-subunit alcohol dehydrogenase family)